MDVPVDWSKIGKEGFDPPYFQLENFKTEAKVLSVYDGDTIKVAFPYFGKMYKWKCRILRINAPEVRGDGKEDGIKVRDQLREMILGKIVNVNCEKFDSFGRVLSEIEYNGVNISDYLLNNTDGLVTVYEK